MKKRIFIIIVVLVVIAAGVLAFPLIRERLNPNQGQSTYQTEPAKMGNMTVFVGATGTVRANQTATINWQASGRVGKVNFTGGQLVQSDNVLAELDPTSVAQNLIQAQADLINAKNDLEKLMTNTEARANAQLALIQAQKAVDDAEKTSRSKLYQRASQETIDIARANLITANEALDSAETAFSSVRVVGDKSPVYAAALSSYAKARQTQLQAEYNLRYVQDLPNPLDIEEVNAKLAQAKAKLLTAKQDWEKIKDGPNPDDIRTAQVRVSAAETILNLVYVKAPFTGTITDAKTQVGDLVNAGTPAFQIDDLSRLLIDVQVSEVDINRVQVGQPVSLAFDANPGVEYSGTVDEIATTGTTSSGAVNFVVTVEISNPDENIKPGMTAAANIAISQLENVLLVPSRAVKTVNNKRVVYVLRNNLPVPFEIKLGSSANNYSQITSGDIKSGDPIVLNPPANLQVGPGGGGPGGGGGQQ